MKALADVVSQGDFTVPPYPAIAVRLQRLLARDSYGVAEVADVLAADAALAATVLAAANSALLGSGPPITSLSRAVNRLGARTVGAIAVATGVSPSAVAAGALVDVKFRVWRRTMICALTCQKLGAARGLAPDEAFLSGLLHGFGRSIAVASLERVLKTYHTAWPLSAEEWLGIAEEQRAALARAVARSWELPQVIAEAIDNEQRGVSALNDLVLDADAIAGEIEACRSPQGGNPVEARLLDELVLGLPIALEAFASPVAAGKAATGPSAFLAKPEHALAGELRPTGLALVDRGSKKPASLSCISVAPAGIEAHSSKRFQECAVVRLMIGEGDAAFEPWFTVALCVPDGPRYRVELQLFSPTRELREKWHRLYASVEPQTTAPMKLVAGRSPR